MISSQTLSKIEELFTLNDKQAKFHARQLLFANIPASVFVETYLNNNEGQPQKLDLFPMLRPIYDFMPRRVLLKCSRKTLKSTINSNMIVLNLIRFNDYSMMYVVPSEMSTKDFSKNYLSPRLDSPALKKIISGWRADDVFEKILEDTGSSIKLRYVKDDASRTRGPSIAHLIVDEVQDINFNALPIILETMAMLDVGRECYTGTPLTTDNCIQKLWKESCQMEWMTRCGCGHWNSLTEENEPMTMIRKEGLCCHKCSKVLNTIHGEWVMFKPEKADFVGYHLAQPILPHYNLNKEKWEKIYRDVYGGMYTIGQVYNEKFGLAYDAGVKLITEAEIRKCCVLGKSIEGGKHKIYHERQHRYKVITAGVDWGVNPAKSRSVIVVGGLREDLVYEVFYHKLYEDIEYDKQIEEMGNVLQRYDGWCAADSGPDSLRSIHLIQRMSQGNENLRGQLVRYEDKPQLIQTYKIPPDSVDWRSHRLCLHRTDTITFTINLLKKRMILLPSWDEIEKPAQDILAEYVEIREGPARQVMDYRHNPDRPDDFLHALNFAAVQAYIWAEDPTLTGYSSTSNYNSDEPGME